MSLSAPTEDDIQRIVDLVVAEVSPLRVVLFGSAARGEQREDSDVDLMVVVPDGVRRLDVSKKLHRRLGEQMRDGLIPVLAVDFVVTTPSNFEQHRNSLSLVYRDIDRDGRQVYAA